MLLNFVMMGIVLGNTWKHPSRILPVFQGNNFSVLSEGKMGEDCLG